MRFSSLFVHTGSSNRVRQRLSLSSDCISFLTKVPKHVFRCYCLGFFHAISAIATILLTFDCVFSSRIFLFLVQRSWCRSNNHSSFDSKPNPASSLEFKFQDEVYIFLCFFVVNSEREQLPRLRLIALPFRFVFYNSVVQYLESVPHIF